jgi:L-lactate dehydrogenase complex protein LldE
MLVGAYAHDDRESIIAMRVALFVTCLVDTLYPRVGEATVRVLRRAGVEVVFPPEQTCCGQLHHNAGYVREARVLAERYGRVFDGFDAVVTPSGSCAGHVRAHVPALAPQAASAAAATLELSELLVGRLGVADVGSAFAGAVAYHPTCHSLRVLRVGDAPERLLQGVPGVELRPLAAPTECCGFGGTFAVKNAAVSSAMLADKLDDVVSSGADVVCACDSSCLMHIGGGLERRGAPVRALHLAEVLAS